VIYLLDLILETSKSILYSQVHDVVETSEPLTLPVPLDIITLKEHRELLNKQIIAVCIVDGYGMNLVNQVILSEDRVHSISDVLTIVTTA
jgi:hypothetical protein